MRTDAAARCFGRLYTEATRKPGQAPRPGMKTLADQGDDDQDTGQRVRFKCPECEQMTTMRKMLARADEGAEDEAAGRLADARCAKCGEALSLEAPRGYRWASEAVHSFARRYGRAIEASRLRHGALRVM